MQRIRCRSAIAMLALTRSSKRNSFGSARSRFSSGIVLPDAVQRLSRGSRQSWPVCYFCHAQLIEIAGGAKPQIPDSNTCAIISKLHRRLSGASFVPPARFPSSEAFGRRPRYKPHHLDGPSSETLHRRRYHRRLAIGFAASRARSMKSFAAALMVRFFKVVIAIGLRVDGSSTGRGLTAA
jgi:hypothetical protein